MIAICVAAVLLSTTTTTMALSIALSMATPLSGKGRVAVVTGASRGIGRGIALELGSAGYKVYCLGRSSRSTRDAPAIDFQRPVAEGLDLTVESAAEEITKRGGIGIAVPCDLGKDGVIEDILDNTVRAANDDRLDVLVCSAYTTPPTGIRGEFWKQDLEMWDYVNGLGLRQVYAACRAAAPILIDTADKNTVANQQPPLVCLVSSFGGKSYTFNVAYGVGKAAIDRFSLDMSYQLKKYGVATTTLYPGLVKTEANLQMEEDGKAVVELAALSKDSMMDRSGNVEVVAELATEFGFLDTNGKKPASIRSLKYLLPNFVFPSIEKELEDGKEIPAWIKDNVPDILVPWSTFSSGPPPEMDSR